MDALPLYISSIETPLNFTQLTNVFSAKAEIYFIAFYPIIASAMQYLGGYTKLTAGINL